MSIPDCPNCDYCKAMAVIKIDREGFSERLCETHYLKFSMGIAYAKHVLKATITRYD